MIRTQETLGSRRALFRNGATIGSARIATAALGLLTVPIIIARLGVLGFGIWEAMIALGTFATTFQGTINGTLMWRMAQEYGSGRSHQIPRFVQLGIASSLVFCAILTPIAFLVRFAAVRALHVPLALQNAATEIFPILIAILALTGIADALDAAINANQRAGTSSTITACGLVVNYLVSIGGLLAGWRFSALVAGLATSLVLRIVAGTLVASRLSGPISLLPVLPRRIDVASLRYGALLAIGFVSSVLRDQTDKIVLALFGSALLVGYYGIAVRLASLLNEVSRLFYLPLLNAAGALNATGAWSAIQELYGTAMRLVPLATGILLIVVGGLANQVITLWIGTPTPAVIPFLLILLLGNVAAVTLTGPGTSICRGIGRVEIETAYVLTNLVGNIVLTILLVHAIGAFGTVIASSVTWAVSSIVFLILLHRRLALPVARSQSAVLALVAAAAIAMALVATIPPSLGTQSRASALLSIIVLGIPSAFIYLVFAFWLGLVPREAPRIASRWIAGALPR